LNDLYGEQPEAALVTLSATGTLGEGITCSVNTGRALAKAGLHPATGGDGLSLCSGDTLLHLTERYCVVDQTLTAGHALTASWERVGR